MGPGAVPGRGEIGMIDGRHTMYNPAERKIDLVNEQTFRETLDQYGLDFRKASKVVFKVGSDLIDLPFISYLHENLERVMQDRVQPIIVTSGAIKTAKNDLGIRLNGTGDLRTAYAAVGQPVLMDYYSSVFGSKRVAQLLFTRRDLDPSIADQSYYQQAVVTLENCIRNSIVPVVNENDSVVTEEIEFGDNDRLSAYVANAVDADVLVVLSKHALYDKNPENADDPALIEIVPFVDDTVRGFAGQDANSTGTGGMRSKLEARQILDPRIPFLIVEKDPRWPSLLDRVYRGTCIGSAAPE
ncbi:hypothetical protein GF351_01635 [Candidatus Woesearchaeota archaeon]|nr:hypothetical protein [Candidatus Woesearchaeota archaeon]